jgi:hypothetical protein
MDKIYNMYKSKLQGHDNLDLFIQADPTGKKYVRWIVDSYVNGGIKRDEDLLSRVKPVLEHYEYLKSRNILSKQGQSWEQETNIDNYCGIVGCQKKGFEKPGLEELIDKYKEHLEKEEDEKETKTAIELYNDDQIRIIQPTTKEDACYYGQSTKWCTAAKNDNMFDHYSKLGPLYIIIPKNPNYKDEKYQLSFDNNQFMNEKDEEVSLDELTEEYPGIKIVMAKYFVPLAERNFLDSSMMNWNIYTCVKENDLELFKGLFKLYEMESSPNDTDLSYTALNSREFVLYAKSKNINFGIDQTARNAIKNYNIPLIDYFKDTIHDNYDTEYEKFILKSDNLYAFKCIDKKYYQHIFFLIIKEWKPAFTILEYLINILSSFDFPDEDDMSYNYHFISFGLDLYKYISESFKRRYGRSSQRHSHAVREICENMKDIDGMDKQVVQRIVNILDENELLPRDIVVKYIIRSRDAFLLEYLSFDSRTLTEITTAINKSISDEMEEYGEIR